MFVRCARGLSPTSWALGLGPVGLAACAVKERRQRRQWRAQRRAAKGASTASKISSPSGPSETSDAERRFLFLGRQPRFWRGLDVRSWTTEVQRPHVEQPPPQDPSLIPDAKARLNVVQESTPCTWTRGFGRRSSEVSLNCSGSSVVHFVLALLCCCQLVLNHRSTLKFGGQVREFQENQVVLLRGAITDWVPKLHLENLYQRLAELRREWGGGEESVFYSS